MVNSFKSGLLLIFSLFVAIELYAAPQQQAIGKRLKKGITSIVVYSTTSNGKPDLGVFRILNSNFYINETSITETIGGVTYRFINIPTGSSAISSVTPSPFTQLVSHDLGKSFWIKESDLTEANFEIEYQVSRWDVYLTSLPFKYRWSFKQIVPSTITGEGLIGPTISWRMGKDGLGNVFNLSGGAGFSFINKSLYNDSSSKSIDDNLSGAFTVHLGFAAIINKVSINLAYGYDFTSEQYLYNKMPWVSIGISGQLSTLKFEKQ